MITHQIKSILNLNKQDHLLDLCCGNGALTALLIDDCKSIEAVDFSDYLIEVAQKKFTHSNINYVLSDVVDYCKKGIHADKVNKALCYGSIAYLSDSQVIQLLTALKNNYPSINEVLIGNIPDTNRYDKFSQSVSDVQISLTNCDSALGIWRSPDEFTELIKPIGWVARVHKMPDEFVASHYRYDLLINRV